ncbi:MAG: zinc-finger domain-containing protein [Pseudomonadota bacterium]|nr:zinc-finger domain-containing protein [Pseudomonadota bacterium]
MSNNFQTELKYIDNDSVSCQGDGWAEPHPLVYLDLSSGKPTICPYCSCKFQKKK